MQFRHIQDPTFMIRLDYIDYIIQSVKICFQTRGPQINYKKLWLFSSKYHATIFTQSLTQSFYVLDKLIRQCQLYCTRLLSGLLSRLLYCTRPSSGLSSRLLYCSRPPSGLSSRLLYRTRPLYQTLVLDSSIGPLYRREQLGKLQLEVQSKDIVKIKISEKLFFEK